MKVYYLRKKDLAAKKTLNYCVKLKLTVILKKASSHC